MTFRTAEGECPGEKERLRSGSVGVALLEVVGMSSYGVEESLTMRRGTYSGDSKWGPAADEIAYSQWSGRLPVLAGEWARQRAHAILQMVRDGLAVGSGG